MAIAFVNASNGFGAGAATTVASTASSLTTGNTNIVGIRLGNNNPSVISVTDTAGNTYFPTGANDHTSASALSIWYAYNCTGNAANVVTATFNSTTNRSIVTVQVSGLATTFPLDTYAISTSTTSATPTTAALTTTVANEIIIVFGDNDASGSAWSASASYTLATQDSSNFQGAAYEIVSAIQTGITPSITSVDSTNHKVAIAVTFWGAPPSPTNYGPGSIVVSDANANNGLDGVMISSTTGATIDTRLPLGAFDGNGSGECGAQISNGTFLVPSKITSTGTIRSIQIYDKTFTQLSVTQPFTSTHWNAFSPMASDFSSLFWVSIVDTSLSLNATQARSVTTGGTLGSVLTLDDSGGPLVRSMAVSQDDTKLYYTLNTNGSAIKIWNIGSNTSGGTLVASGGSTYFGQDLIVVPSTSSLIAIVQPGGSAGTSFKLNQYSTTNGSVIASYALTGNIGNFSGPNLSLDLGAPSTTIWIRTYTDGTGATTGFVQFSLATGMVLNSFTVNMNNGGAGGGNASQVPLSCPFFSWSKSQTVQTPIPPWPTAPPFTVGTGGLQAVPLRRMRRMPFPVAPGNAKQRVARIELQFQPGTGLASAPTTPPEFMVRMSFDQGHTWSMERVLSGGQIGSYSTRAFANGWGHGRWPVIEVTASDQTDWVLTDCFAVVSAGDR